MKKIPILLLAIFFASCGLTKPETDCTKYAQLSYDATYTLCKALQLFAGYFSTFDSISKKRTNIFIKKSFGKFL